MASQRDRDEEREKRSRAERIRNGFTGGGIHEYGEDLDRIGFFKRSDHKRQREYGRNKEIRDALSQLTLAGVPFAGPTVDKTESDETYWEREPLWSQLTFDVNCSRRTNRSIASTIVRDALSAECERIHGEPAKFNLTPEEIQQVVERYRKGKRKK